MVDTVDKVDTVQVDTMSELERMGHGTAFSSPSVPADAPCAHPSARLRQATKFAEVLSTLRVSHVEPPCEM